jgi:hypothetical protein
MIYLTTNSNGYDKEGIGSVVQWHLILYGICKKLELNFFANKFTNISHYQYNKIRKDQWDLDYTNFFNIHTPQEFDIEYNFNGSLEDLDDFIHENKNSTERVCIEVTKDFIIKYGFPILDEMFLNRHLMDIKNNLQYNKKRYFNSDKINISLHLRCLNSADIPTYPSMETYLVYKNANDIKKIFNVLKQKYKNRKVCLYVHSQGESKNFLDLIDFSTDNFEIILKLNENPIDDIYHMSNADILIMSKSSYSWICHLLNFNQTIVRDDFYQPTYPNRVLLDSNYNFNPGDLVS